MGQLPAKLYKTTLVIWSQYNPDGMPLEDLAREADQGDAYCSNWSTVAVTNQADFPDTEFFGVDDDVEGSVS